MATDVRSHVDLAKHPVTGMAGPYGHPFHPIFVTIPIGTWVASFVFDLVSRAADDPAPFVIGARWLVGIGILGALVAALFGFMDLLAIPRGTRAFATGLTHMTLNLATTGLFAVSWFWRGQADTIDGTPIALLVLSAVALAMLSVSGWLGGRMAYRFGVRVAEERDQASGYS